MGNGESINIWADKLVPGLEFKVCSNPLFGNSICPVDELISKNERGWNSGALVRALFSDEEAGAVLKIPISISNCSDCLVWNWSKSGDYLVKSAILWL